MDGWIDGWMKCVPDSHRDNNEAEVIRMIQSGGAMA
jgi:hypothetical protein